MKRILFLALLALTACSREKPEIVYNQNLHENWDFKGGDFSEWMTAEVPGEVQSDLWRNEKIANPYVGYNERESAVQADKTWYYKCVFNLAPETKKHSNKLLRFHGIDTYADVILNGRLLFSSDNAFRVWEKDVSDLLREDENELIVRFLSEDSASLAMQKEYGLELPGKHRVFTRKPAFHYGWDWGPEIRNIGLWRNVELIAWTKARIEDVRIKADHIKEDKAKMHAYFEIESDEVGEFTISIGNHYTWLRLKKGMNMLEIPFDIKNPQLWSPDNPKLYSWNVKLFSYGNELDNRVVTTGLRTVELIREKDTKGESFYFRLNGNPVFIKGANYIPADIFQSEARKKGWRNLLTEAKNRNMNMLRVWGGGLYEEDIFYDLCDSLGIMVWQDFMYACAMYPGDSAFLENAAKEAEENIKRLYNHPSVVLWCGNNESSEGWQRWGWQDAYSPAERERIEKAYNTLFKSILPEKVEKFSPGLDYHESSPLLGRGDPQHVNMGDAHYWGIWHDQEDFGMLAKKVPRFMSEFGMQSFPSAEVLKQACGYMPLSPYDTLVKNHQKHIRGQELITYYLANYLNIPGSMDNWIYNSQVVQAWGIGYGIAEHRMAMPYCMGSLFWQYNDCWPAISWSSIDYSASPKALQYRLKQYYAKETCFLKYDDNKYQFYWVSDLEGAHEREITLRLFTYWGQKVKEKTIDIQYSGPVSMHITQLDAFLKSMNPVLHCLSVSGEGMEPVVLTAGRPRNWGLQPSQLSIIKTREGKGYKLRISTDIPALFVRLNSPVQGLFSDNYFDLVPGIEKEVWFYTEEENPAIYYRTLKIFKTEN